MTEKISRRIRRVTTGTKETFNLYDEALDRKVKNIFSVVFSIAEELKITPKKLAKFVYKTDANKYAEEFSTHLHEIARKEAEKDAKELRKELGYKTK